MTAKTREDIGSARSDVLLAISRTEAMLLDQFQDAAMAGKIKRRLDSDITSIYSGDYVTITLAGHSPTTAPTVKSVQFPHSQVLADIPLFVVTTWVLHGL